jgi:hypothetical protein
MRTLLRSFDASRLGRIFLLAFPVAGLAVGFCLWTNPLLSDDEIAVSVSVPLMISYILIRLVILLVSKTKEPTKEEMERFEEMRKQGGTVEMSFLLAFAFIAGMWAAITDGLSLIVFNLMGLVWAANNAMLFLRVFVLVVATSAVFLCLKMLCRMWIVKIAHWLREIFHFPIPGHHGG